MNRILYTSLLFVCFLFSCQESRNNKNSNKCNKKEEANDISTIGNKMDSILILQEKVLNNGDTIAYIELKEIAMELPPDDFLFWSLMMANKYDYAPAYYDVFYTLLEANKLNINEINSLDEKTKKIAINYLKLGAEKGDSNSIAVLEVLKKI